VRVLVTGGGGFIGSNLVEALLERGDDVRVLDNFFSGRRENLANVDEWAGVGGGSFELIEGDVRDRDLVNRAVEGCDGILHQAAIPSVARSVSDPLASHEVNVNGLLHILLAARESGVSRVVMASSSSLYGESPTLPKVETMPSDPISPYGLDKLSGETYFRLFYDLYGLPTVALRYFNVFGPRQDPNSEYSAVIPKFIAMMASGQAPTIHGDGEQTRDFTYIDNVVQANLRALEAPTKALGQAFNVACGDRISLLDLVEKLNAVMGTRLAPVHGPPRAGDIQHSLAGIEKARDLLGYEPSVTMDEGLARTVASLTGQSAPS